jgi:hypothetical protein
LAQQIQFILVEAAFQTQKPAVIAVPRRIDGLLVDQHGVDYAAHLDELLPVPAVAGKARHLTGANRADLTQTDLGHHPLEASALHAASGRRPSHHRSARSLNSERRQSIPHGVLQRAALAIVQHLVGRRLAHVEKRLARQMMGVNLGQRSWPASLAGRRHGLPGMLEDQLSIKLVSIVCAFAGSFAMRGRRRRCRPSLP